MMISVDYIAYCHFTFTSYTAGLLTTVLNLTPPAPGAGEVSTHAKARDSLVQL